MSSSSSDGTDNQITDATSPDLSVKSMPPAQPLRYITVPDRDCPIRKSNMIWFAALSTFVLNRVCDLVKEWMTGGKFFTNRDLKAIVQAVLEYTGLEVGVDQLYNHLRHWRARWVHVSRLKMVEGARWEDKAETIMMDDDAYYAHIKTIPRDAEFINKAIELCSDEYDLRRACSN